VDARAETVIVFTGGDPVDPAMAVDVPRDGLVVAADSGLDHARRLGWPVDLVVGDLDSVSADALEGARRDGASIEVSPVAKDVTDLELALEAAVTHRPRRIVVVGGHGGRVDHFLANAAALTSESLAGVEVEAHTGAATLYVIRAERHLRGEVGEIVSLLPVHGPAIGVTTTGLLYPLRGETLEAASGRGVSNQFVESEAVVSLTGGVLLAVRPHVLGPPLSLPSPEEPS
jgi:thiamine pyrophosphokinase